jgi:hypothetical protein
MEGGYEFLQPCVGLGKSSLFKQPVVDTEFDVPALSSMTDCLRLHQNWQEPYRSLSLAGTQRTRPLAARSTIRRVLHRGN